MHDSNHRCDVLISSEIDRIREAVQESPSYAAMNIRKLARLVQEAIEDVSDFIEKPSGDLFVALSVPLKRFIDVTAC
jgi:hypothetical protein